MANLAGKNQEVDGDVSLAVDRRVYGFVARNRNEFASAADRAHDWLGHRYWPLAVAPQLSC